MGAGKNFSEPIRYFATYRMIEMLKPFHWLPKIFTLAKGIVFIYRIDYI